MNKEKMKFCLMPYGDVERNRKREFKDYVKESKQEVKKLRAELKEKVKALKAEIEEKNKQTKLKYTPRTQEEYEERLEGDRRFALEHNWEVVEVGDKSNTYSAENKAKERKKKAKALNDFLSGVRK